MNRTADIRYAETRKRQGAASSVGLALSDHIAKKQRYGS